MSAEAKALLGQVVFNDPKGLGAHAMEFGQFRARDTRELTQGCVAGAPILGSSSRDAAMLEE
jgi:hypothetical protein